MKGECETGESKALGEGNVYHPLCIYHRARVMLVEVACSVDIQGPGMTAACKKHES